MYDVGAYIFLMDSNFLANLGHVYQIFWQISCIPDL